MKSLYILLVLFLLIGGVFSVYAQDLIILKDGNIIEAKVMEISPTEIRYKRFDHLDGPTIVIMAVNVLSIRYENGRTDIINDNTQPITTNPIVLPQPVSVKDIDQLDRNPRFNTLGLSLGYLGVSNFGFSLKGTVSPAPYTFFDFNMGLGFENFSFNGNINFNGFVPFRKGGWYGGLGLGGGVYEFADLMNGYFAINAITGFLFFNWLNINATLEMEVVPEFDIRFKPMAGYVYRFKSQENIDINTEESSVVEQKPKEKRPPIRDTTYRHWISGDIGFFISELMGFGTNIGINYEYVFTPRFSLNIYYNYTPVFFDDYYYDYYLDEVEKINIGINIILRCYPSARLFFMELGLGYNYYGLRFNDAGYNESGFNIIPGIGWKIDTGKPGGFFITPGLRYGFIMGKNAFNDLSFDIRVLYYCSFGYAF